MEVMLETNVLKTVQLFAARIASLRLFRNNTGTAWTGNEMTRLKNGDLLIKDPRPVHFGLFKGSSDLIGWDTVTVTPEMVGTKVAIFTAIEVKTAKGRATDEQKHFIETVNLSGGKAGVARQGEDLNGILKGGQKI